MLPPQKPIRKAVVSFRDDPKDQTSDVQLHIGESQDSGFDASHRPGMTESASGLREQLVDIFPVHEMIDKRLQIIRAAVAIIDVIGVLPDVDTEDRRRA